MCAVSVEDSDHSGLYSFAALYEAYYACRRRKRQAANTLCFEHDLLQNLVLLVEELSRGQYQPTRSVCFVAKQPKLREIFAADFRDRVVHHLLVPRLEALFEPKFIHDSFACRLGKGTHAAMRRLRVFMNQATRGGRRPAWFLQLDVRSFFMSIDKAVLCGIMEKHVKEPALLDLTRRLILHDCTTRYVYKGLPGLLQRVPEHKSLFHALPGKGLPIGNLTSQFFANVYLNELDQYVKHTLKARCYLRYVDDFILVHESKDELVRMKSAIELYLSDKLKLSLKPDAILKRVSEGADFIGYIVRPDYVLARNRVVGNLKAMLDRFEKVIVGRGVVGNKGFVLHRLPEEIKVDLRQRLSSYVGHLKHANTRRLIGSIFKRYQYLNDVFRLAVNEFRLELATEPKVAPLSLHSQYAWFERSYGTYCIFFQVGRFFELYGKQAEHYSALLGLKAAKGSRGLGAQSGFPRRLLEWYKRLCLSKAQDYVVVEECGYYAAGLKRRAVTEVAQCAV